MRPLYILAPVLLVAACATAPTGPTVQVMPGKGKSTEVFTADNAICKQFASDQVEGASGHANTVQLLTSAVPAVLGAGIGAAFGGGKGAAIGGALGAAGGVGYGGYASGNAQASLQDRYNVAFTECMQTRHNWAPARSAGR